MTLLCSHFIISRPHISRIVEFFTRLLNYNYLKKTKRKKKQNMFFFNTSYFTHCAGWNKRSSRPLQWSGGQLPLLLPNNNSSPSVQIFWRFPGFSFLGAFCRFVLKYTWIWSFKLPSRRPNCLRAPTLMLLNPSGLYQTSDFAAAESLRFSCD